MSAQTIVPNQTLYCRNLPNKIQKQDLRRALYLLFSTYGSVLDVVALKTMKMRGQAHVVFKDIQSSTQAMRALQGMEFFGMELKISYAKSKSNTISKLDGTFNIPSTGPSGSTVPGAAAQPSIFTAPIGLPSAGTTTGGAAPAKEASPAAIGTKRPRDESEGEEDGDAPMEDEESEMEMSDED
ncbi:RNA-binding domain-containing protein [Eremomyces bilateralis CBS 781.70]|uniref:RNA-binding domain-containing protein n=1 Tax=Eremomyces bilateralis CBS 781.70 TaxID=1392243 RepID=A0A6G1GD34_9PEZI|nr:RNA-binding domain-containing protein [Eremomyces bilateralis CBS 781.70]KAF1815922.1 RNA-binding domain-containing protein [Eremomyces bilateralis CBS 781.70]